MKTKLFTAVIALFILFACENADDKPGNTDLSEKSEQLIKADNEFGLEMFSRIYKSPDCPENYMISPLSISLALSMAYNGANTQTKEEMQKAMRLGGLKTDEINPAHKALVEALINTDEKVIMEVANSIWYRNAYNVEDNFLNINKDYYNAEVHPANFDSETVSLINDWVSDKTHEKITKIIEEIPAEAVLYLINAIYFNGTWTKEFNKENTHQWNFKTSEGNTTVDMMMRRDSVDYFSNETFSSVKLPYGKENFNMMVLLPQPGKSVDDILQQLTPSNWEKWQNAFSFTNSIEILLPKFKIEYEEVLNNYLYDMGMQLAFTPMADFSGINPARDLYISFVKHKTFVEVDEEGTEAAAVTIIGFETTSERPSGPQWIPFHSDRPFLFAITEKDTGAILFIGKVGNPANKE